MATRGTYGKKILNNDQTSPLNHHDANYSDDLYLATAMSSPFRNSKSTLFRYRVLRTPPGYLFDASPELHNSMIDGSGNLVYRPEFKRNSTESRRDSIESRSDSIEYKLEASSGGFRSSQFNIDDDDTLDRYAAEQLNNIFMSVKKGTKWLETNFVQGIATEKKRIEKSCHELYGSAVTVPGQVNERFEKERRMLGAELELVRLQLVEARLQVEEARLRGKATGVSVGVYVLYVRFMQCLNILLLTSSRRSCLLLA